MSDATGRLGEWLALREPADAASRSRPVTEAVLNALADRPHLRLLDLGTGTGSNVRYLRPYLPAAHEWLVVDRDPTLLARQTEAVVALQRDLESLDAELFEQRDLVTASALLDLASVRWIERLAVLCRAAGTAVLFALNYDGRSACQPREPEDDLVRELFNRHQRCSDKGFGTAAGPDAARATAQAFAAAGYEVCAERSDWGLPPESRQLQRQLIEGWAAAATAIAPDRSAVIADWLQRRLAHVERGASRVGVGHVDVGGWPIR